MPATRGPRSEMSKFEGLGTYLEAVSRYPLLTPEQELLFGRQIQTWVTTENPSKQVERVGRKALDRMVLANLRLVVSISKQYLTAFEHMSLLDVVQEGNAGLITAAKKFDPTRGYRFTTVAYWWIRQAVMRAIGTQDRTIRIPINAGDRMRRMVKFVEAFRRDHHRSPTLAECAKGMGHELESLEILAPHGRACLSLDAVLSGMEDTDSGTSLLSCLASKSAGPMEIVEDQINGEALGDLFDALNEQELNCVVKHLGLDGSEPLTLINISKEIGVSRERVRQIVQKGYRKMRVKAGLEASVR